MIERLMKAVKSSSKKRGINITVGTVVGFLLSCTPVMSADDYLWIKENGGAIEFSINNGGTINLKNPYETDGNIWDGSSYVNNITLSGTDNDTSDNYTNIGYGLKLSGNLSGLNFKNNETIVGTSKGTNILNYGYGMYINNLSAGNIINSGMISGNNVDGEASGIYIENSSIENIINNGKIEANTIKLNGFGIYLKNKSSIENIMNSGIINGSGKSTNRGIYIEDSSVENIINSGIISGSIGEGYVCGIYLTNTLSIKNIKNSGIITSNGKSSSSGIDVSYGSSAGNIINSGIINGSTSDYNYSYGINILRSTVENIINSGIINSSSASDKGSYVMYINNYSTVENIINSGTINDSNTDIVGYGIYINNSSVENITNTGVVYGKINAISRLSGTVNNAVNYGILANGSRTNVVNGLTVTNYGLVIKNGVIEKVGNPTSPLPIEFGNETKSMTIENKESGSVTGNKTNHILNGLTDTYKADKGDNTVTDSIINAYKTAVAFDTAGGKLALSGTTVNGGLDGTSNTITGNDGADTLGLYNTIINGNIAMGAEADTLTIGNGTIINGTLDGGSGNDTLNFGTASNTRAGSGIDDNINIQHNISGFENMNINTNVTLFEKTINASGELSDLTVTGADNITVGKNGVLTLRIDPRITDVPNGKITGHALYGNTGKISSEGGKLLLALNGAGNSSIISFGNLKLDSSLVTGHEGTYLKDVTLGTTSMLHSVKRVDGKNNEIEVTALNNLPLYDSIHGYKNLNKIYQGIFSVNELGNFNVSDNEKLSTFLTYLNNIYGGNPYSFSSELSRKSAGMFRDIVTENQFKANTGKWMIYGGLTHVDGGTKDTYYGKGYYTYDVGSSDIDGDTKITGAYMLGEYGVSDTLTSGVVIGGNKLKSDLSNGSKVDGSALYLGAYAKKYIGNLKVTGGAGFQYGDYDADRLAVNKVASSTGTPVIKYSDNYNDITYDIYLNGRYSHNIGENLFLEPYGTLSYTYIDQDGADEGGKTLAIETDSKSFDYTTAKVGLDLKKVIPHEKGKSTLSAGVSYTKILDGADEEYITGRFKGGRDFDILVAHKNEHSIGLNAKYALELENGILFDVKGTYSVERDSHNQSGKNRNKGEWIVGTGLGYKF